MDRVFENIILKGWIVIVFLSHLIRFSLRCASVGRDGEELIVGEALISKGKSDFLRGVASERINAGCFWCWSLQEGGVNSSRVRLRGFGVWGCLFLFSLRRLASVGIF